MKEGSFKVVVRDYHAKGDRPYRNVFHSVEDSNIFDKRTAMDVALAAAGVADGDEVEITVKKTGRCWKRRWVLLEPNVYGPEEEEDESHDAHA